MAVSMCSCPFKHVLLNILKNDTKFCLKFIKRNFKLLVIVSSYHHAFICLYILRANLYSHRDTTHFLVSKLKARCLVAVIKLNPKVCGQPSLKLIRLLKHTFLVLHNRNYHHLCRRNPWRKHETVVITVNHDKGTYHSGTYSPGGLVAVFNSIVLICKCNIISPCKSITEVVACT